MSPQVLPERLVDALGGIFARSVAGEPVDVPRAAEQFGRRVLQFQRQQLARQVEETLGTALLAQVDVDVAPLLRDFVAECSRLVPTCGSGRRARLVARDQVLRLAARAGRERALALGVGRYEWLARCPAHAALSGQLRLAAGAGPHPGDGPLCDCSAEPCYADLLPQIT